MEECGGRRYTKEQGFRRQRETMPCCEKSLEIKGYIFGGVLFGLPRSRLSPLEHGYVELTIFAR
jgi:hypothetical protein